MANSSGESDLRRQWFRAEILPIEPTLLGYANRLCRASSDEARDLLHETYAKIISYPSWRDVANPAAFALRVMGNIARDTLRRRKIVSFEMVADLDRLGRADQQPDPETCAIHNDELRFLRALIESMPTQMRRVFTLKKVYGLSQNEIADRLGLTVSTVEKHVVRGLRFCSERMDRSPLRSRKLDGSAKWNLARDHLGT